MANRFEISKNESVNLLVQTCLENGVTDQRQVAFVLATAQHETMNFTKPEEIDGRGQARKLGYRGGEEFFGRGYVHLTHKDNYEKFDRLTPAEKSRHP
jgi:predicted chitinase